jgi:hypothetical protein
MIIDVPIELIPNYMIIIIYTLVILLIGYCLGVYVMTKVCFHLWFVKFNLNKLKVDLSDEDYVEFTNYVIKMVEHNKVMRE